MAKKSAYLVMSLGKTSPLTMDCGLRNFLIRAATWWSSSRGSLFGRVTGMSDGDSSVNSSDTRLKKSDRSFATSWSDIPGRSVLTSNVLGRSAVL